MRLPSLKFGILLCCYVTLQSPLIVQADTLEHIQESAVMNRIKRENFDQKLNNAGDWLPPGKNLSRIFSHLKGPQLLHSWLSIPSTKYRTTKEFSKLYGEYAFAKKFVTSNKTGALYEIEAYVPHPRYEHMASHNLIPVMAQLEPPKLEVEYSEEHNIQDYACELHQHKTQVCSVLFKLDKSSRINLKTSCKNNEELLKLAEIITLARFEKKVNS